MRHPHETGPPRELRIPGNTRVSDAITRMNAHFVISAAISGPGGAIVGFLDGELLSDALAEDADRALRSTCDTLLESRSASAA